MAPPTDPAAEDQLVQTKAASGVRQMFHDIAPTYDYLNHLLSLNIDKRWRKLTAKLLIQTNVHRVLDVCSGTGDMAVAFAEQAMRTGITPPQIYSADFTPAMTQIAKIKTAALPIAPLVADTMHLPFPDNTFDIVSVAFGIRNVEDLRAGLAEMTRVCRAGGRVAVLEFSHPSTPGLRQMYNLYFFQVLPRLGRLISGTRAYMYLPKSVAKFPDSAPFATLLQKETGGPVQVRRLTFGIATLYIAEVTKA